MLKVLYALLLSIIISISFSTNANSVKTPLMLQEVNAYEKGLLASKNKDFTQAVKLYEMAANQGHVDAQFNLANIYANGLLGQKDYVQAAKWYEIAANQGDMEAQYNMGFIFSNGLLGQKDYTQAVKWYKKAAIQGYMESQYKLANIYINGLLGQKDYAGAAKWLEMAANQGHISAQHNLGFIYSEGLLDQKDYTQAVKWYEMAAKQGNKESQFNLGIIYHRGLLGRVDYISAAKWLEMAAKQGHLNAQYNLGNYYFSGKLGKPDNALAAKWIVNAANQGFIPAKKRIKTIITANNQKHSIIGSNAELSGYYEILSDIKVSRLQVRLVREYLIDYCKQGFKDHIELNGTINHDSSFVVEKLLKNISPCIGFDDTKYVTNIYLNSSGGLLNDGYKLGRTFQNYGVHAKVSYEQICASSCAIAFLGAQYRSIHGDGVLLFHAPYVVGEYGKIYCNSRQNEKSLKNYYSEMLGSQKGTTLFTRTMDYCSQSSGWTINKDAAKIYELAN